MFKTFALSFKLRNAYKTNSIIWALKGIPLVKKILPNSLYASKGLKIFATVISIIIEIISIFIGKAIYLFFIWSQLSIMKADPVNGFTHVLIFTTLIGGFLNTRIFNPTKDKFYAIFLMRMNPKEYTLTDYLYFLLKMLIGFLLFSFIVGLLIGASLITCILVPLYVIFIKLCFTAVNLKNCDDTQTTKNENKFTWVVWVAVVILLGLAAIPYFGYALPEYILWILTGALLIPTIFSIIFIIRFNNYRSIYKELLKPEYFAASAGSNALGTYQQMSLQKKISTDTTKTSDKSGYKYFNEIFMKRHSKILTRSTKRITAIILIFFVAAITALYIFPQSHSEVNMILLNYMPYALFIMYLLNRGRAITQAMFMNCDHSMLAYRFYRQPKAILSLFTERLKYVIVLNLIPAVVISIFLPVILYITGGTPEILNYFVLFFTIIAMSIFFSIHNMVLYYLLQPYNVNLESKSATYAIINWITYIISYAAIQVKLPTLWFGIVVSAFCIVYGIVALILAYRLAPKTFKLRN